MVSLAALNEWMEYRVWKSEWEAKKVRKWDKKANRGTVSPAECPKLNAAETRAAFEHMLGGRKK